MLIVVFGSIVAAVLPIVMALFAIMVALGLVALVGQLFSFNLFVENMVTMIGLAVGIDYSLFIVSRYREERKKGFAKLDAIGAAGRDGEPRRLLQRPDRRPRAARHADHPGLDLPRARRRRDPRHDRARSPPR